MDESLFTTQEWQGLLELAEEAHHIAVRANTDATTITNEHNALSGYAYSEISNLDVNQRRLTALMEMLFSALGVTIHDEFGAIRDARDVEEDLRAINPKIFMTFQELMQF